MKALGWCTDVAAVDDPIGGPDSGGPDSDGVICCCAKALDWNDAVDGGGGSCWCRGNVVEGSADADDDDEGGGGMVVTAVSICRTGGTV